MKTKQLKSLRRTACAVVASGGFAAAAPDHGLPLPEDTVVLPTAEETAQFIRNIRETELKHLKWDADGWDDLWVMIEKSRDKNYNFDPGDKTRDTDGDGMSDYEEMLTHRSATYKEPVYTKEQLIEQVREGRRQAIARWHAEDKAWKQALVDGASQLRPHVAPGRLNPPDIQADAEQNYAALQAAGAAAARQQQGLDALLAADAARLGIPLEESLENGGKKRLSGFMGEIPLYMADNNHFAAAAISADELWPLNTAPLSEANTGFGLTGIGQTLGLWEVSGGVRLTHNEFGGRIVQPDAAAVDTGGHATNVAGSMVAAGTLGLAAGLDIPELKGVASGANARAFSTADFSPERLNAAGGANNTPQVFLSNHSWGLKAGWHPVQSLTLTNGTVVNGTPTNPLWTWDGTLAQNFQEHFAHGFYTPANANGEGCTQIDLFHHTEAPRHLMVFAAGNDRLEGPGVAVPTYYTVSNNLGTAVTNSNSNYTRDWADGDEGGFDSLDAPGTAKNCLTVGACQDVWRLVNNVRVYGFAPGAAVTNANFSGAGPTDDGRIKPDLVAVGDGDPALRLALGYSSVINGQTVPWDMITAAATTDTNASIFWAGTSAASPTVTGALGLLTQRRQQLYPNLTAADALRGSTLKALAIDGVDDVGPPGPSYDGGHGLMNARTSVQRLNQDQALGRGALVKEFSLAVGASASWIANSVPGATLQTYTLVWSDPQGPALTTLTAPDPQDVMLVNNINIQVEHLESGSIFLPWTLTPDLANRTAAARSAAAVRAVDDRNNVERITISAPLAGRYRITVTHAGSPGGVPGTHPVASAQIVSLVMSGTLPELPKITSLVKSAPATEWMLHFTSDPGAVYTVQTSTDLQTWTNSVTVVAAGMTNSAIVNSTGTSKRFWRLRRGQ